MRHPFSLTISIIFILSIAVLNPVSAQSVTFDSSNTISRENVSGPIPPTLTRNESTIPNETAIIEQERQRIRNQYLVILKDDSGNDTAGLESTLQNLTAKVQSLGLDLVHVYKIGFNGFVFKASNNTTLTDALSILRADPRIESIVQDDLLTLHSQGLPTGINRVDGDRSPTISGNKEGVVNADIAVLDTGIDVDHPDLNVYRSVNVMPFPQNLSGVDDQEGHGTHVAGIAAAKDDQNGVVGIAPGARLWSVKVCNYERDCRASAIIAGIKYVNAHKDEIDAANISIGCRVTGSRACITDSLKELNIVLSNSSKQGVIYTVSAGNDQVDAINEAPANNPDVITVSAIADTDGKCGGTGPPVRSGITTYEKDDTFVTSSNFGSVVDIAAPGRVINSTFKDGMYKVDNGTSMAAPHVAGFVALYKAYNPNTSLSEIRNIIDDRGSNPTIACDGHGYGYFRGDPDNIPEPLLYAKPINQFIISAEGQIESDSLNLLAQGHYICGPSAIATTRDPGIIFNGFLEGQLTDVRYPNQPADLGKITVDATKDIGDVNTIIAVYSEDQTIRLRLVFQGTIDCSQPISQPVINAIDGTICVVSPTWALCGPVSSASLGLR
jgi:subtilisin